jgi:hypothetical protein
VVSVGAQLASSSNQRFIFFGDEGDNGGDRRWDPLERRGDLRETASVLFTRSHETRRRERRAREPSLFKKMSGSSRFRVGITREPGGFAGAGAERWMRVAGSKAGRGSQQTVFERPMLLIEIKSEEVVGEIARLVRKVPYA